MFREIQLFLAAKVRNTEFENYPFCILMERVGGRGGQVENTLMLGNYYMNMC